MIVFSSASCMDNPDSEMVFYLMLRAVDRFYQQHSRYPGTTTVMTGIGCLCFYYTSSFVGVVLLGHDTHLGHLYEGSNGM